MLNIESALDDVKKTLDKLSQDISHGKYPASILASVKQSVDQLRLSLWALMMYEQERLMEAQGAQFALTSKLIEFRIKRLVQMLADLHKDIDAGELKSDTSDLKALSAVLQSTLQSVTKLSLHAA